MKYIFFMLMSVPFCLFSSESNVCIDQEFDMKGECSRTLCASATYGDKKFAVILIKRGDIYRFMTHIDGQYSSPMIGDNKETIEFLTEDPKDPQDAVLKHLYQKIKNTEKG